MGTTIHQAAALCDGSCEWQENIVPVFQPQCNKSHYRHPQSSYLSRSSVGRLSLHNRNRHQPEREVHWIDSTIALMCIPMSMRLVQVLEGGGWRADMATNRHLVARSNDCSPVCTDTFDERCGWGKGSLADCQRHCASCHWPSHWEDTSRPCHSDNRQ